jgi:hypothetical protein
MFLDLGKEKVHDLMSNFPSTRVPVVITCYLQFLFYFLKSIINVLSLLYTENKTCLNIFCNLYIYIYKRALNITLKNSFYFQCQFQFQFQCVLSKPTDSRNISDPYTARSKYCFRLLFVIEYATTYFPVLLRTISYCIRLRLFHRM